MNTFNEFERTIAAARGVVEVDPKQTKIIKANETLSLRRNIGYSGHSDFSDYPSIKDLAMYLISAGVIGIGIGAVYAVFEFIGKAL